MRSWKNFKDLLSAFLDSEGKYYLVSFPKTGRTWLMYMLKEIEEAHAELDEFGEEIPCSGYAEIGGEEIGEEVCKYADPTGIVLLRNHGVFTIGTSAKSAMKKDVMVEDIAKTTYYALKLRNPIELTEEQTKNCYDRYQNTYGQNFTNR